MKIVKIFNKGKKIEGNFTKKDARKIIRASVKNSKIYKEFEPQSKKDFKIEKL